ncbi:glycosyltransferase [Candidatus Trichorickettsia mobilis]|uniref:glycosyltransferase n=1 Tax=Candidatus Trichorickettsia mobilis TaxID=1346319 RepID=UPI00292CF783|nr:glycosyltransferase [Candidatus Trichorickettsia mobilis]
MKVPLLTVVLITYNHEKYIERSIKSILAQKTNFDFIIKVLDDYSIDGTSDIIKKYAKQYPQKIKHILRKENYGIVDNIYQGLCSVNTHYFAEIEGDDYWCDENKLQIAVDILEKNKDCIMFAHNTRISGEDGSTKNIVDPHSGLYKYCPTKFKLETDKIPVYLHFSSRVYQNVFDFSKIDKFIVAFDIGIYYLYLEKGRCYYYDKVMSVYNTNQDSYYFGKSSKEKEKIIHLVLQKLSALFNYKYNKVFLEYVSNRDLFNNIEEAFGEKVVWDLYSKIESVFEKTINQNNSYLLRPLIKSLINQVKNKIKNKTIVSLFRINQVRNKIKNKTITSLFRISRWFDPLKTDLLIFDDVFPHPLSPFRYTEYIEYLKHFKNIRIAATGECLGCIKETKTLQEVIDEFLNKFPLFKNKLAIYRVIASYKPKLIYVNFLGNARRFDLGYEYKFPFIINLYPGGTLQVNDKKVDDDLKRYLGSTYCKKVIVTQEFIYDYLIKNKLCSKEKIELIFGVVTPQELLDMKVENKQRYGFQKKILDICFVAHKYTECGIDKGYDKFIDSAHILTEKYDNVVLHVVGSFDSNVINTSKIGNKIKFYGLQTTEWFKDFYKDKDIIISPNIPFIISPGSFDGFPTASITEAGLHEVVMFATDELNMNRGRFVNGKEIVIIKPNSSDIVEKIEFYLNNPSELKSISKLGALKIKDLYSYEKQIGRRIDIIRRVLSQL